MPKPKDVLVLAAPYPLGSSSRNLSIIGATLRNGDVTTECRV